MIRLRNVSVRSFSIRARGTIFNVYGRQPLAFGTSGTSGRASPGRKPGDAGSAPNHPRAYARGSPLAARGSPEKCLARRPAAPGDLQPIFDQEPTMGCGPNKRILLIAADTAVHDDFRRILCAPPAGVDAGTGAEADAAAQPPLLLEHIEIDVACDGPSGLKRLQEASYERRPYLLLAVGPAVAGDWDAVETVRQAWQHDDALPAVVCTAAHDAATREQVLQLFGRRPVLVPGVAARSDRRAPGGGRAVGPPPVAAGVGGRNGLAAAVARTDARGSGRSRPGRRTSSWPTSATKSARP